MAPIIHCIRHAQGFHNLGSEYHHLRDPRLTPLGESQCIALSESFLTYPGPSPTGVRFQDRISLITASPLTRTIHTAYMTFKDFLEIDASEKKPSTGGSKIFALPDAQETSDVPCDTGSLPSALAASCAEHQWPVDLSLVFELGDSWTDKSLSSRFSPAAHAIAARAADARRWLRAAATELQKQTGNNDVEIVLVTHGGFLHFFTDDWEGATDGEGTGWKNCEIRSYNFASEGTVDAEAYLVETAASRTHRGKTGPMAPAGSIEQARLYEFAMQNLDEQGLQRPDKFDVEVETHSVADSASRTRQDSVAALRAQFVVDGDETEFGSLARTTSQPVKVVA